MGMTREELEQVALEACPADLYYDLLDTLEETSDADLYELIAGEYQNI